MGETRYSAPDPAGQDVGILDERRHAACELAAAKKKFEYDFGDGLIWREQTRF